MRVKNRNFFNSFLYACIAIISVSYFFLRHQSLLAQSPSDNNQPIESNENKKIEEGIFKKNLKTQEYIYAHIIYLTSALAELDRVIKENSSSLTAEQLNQLELQKKVFNFELNRYQYLDSLMFTWLMWLPFEPFYYMPPTYKNMKLFEVEDAQRIKWSIDWFSDALKNHYIIKQQEREEGIEWNEYEKNLYEIKWLQWLVSLRSEQKFIDDFIKQCHQKKIEQEKIIK